MAEWTTCGNCGLKHARRADGTCPRCKQVTEASGTGSPAAEPPLQIDPPLPPLLLGQVILFLLSFFILGVGILGALGLEFVSGPGYHVSEALGLSRGSILAFILVGAVLLMCAVLAKGAPVPWIGSGLVVYVIVAFLTHRPSMEGPVIALRVGVGLALLASLRGAAAYQARVED